MSNVTHELRINGKRMLTADSTTACIIFNNLSGANFEAGKDEAQYPVYLQMMAQDFFDNPEAIKTGDTLEIAAIDKAALVSTTVGSKVRVTDNELKGQ